MTVMSLNRSALSRLVALLFPWRAAPRSGASVPLLVWLGHALVWGGLLVGLWQLNRWVGMQRWLHSPWPILHRVWLPLLGLQVYVLGWLSVGLWNALRRAPRTESYPEVDAAWDEAWTVLAQSRPNVQAAPLFLILGPYTPDLRARLESMGASSVLARAGGPLQVFAHPEAIFVIAANLSMLGLSGTRNSERSRPAASAPDRSAYATGRLRHFCQRLQGERPGQAALQGIVMVVPFPTLHSDTLTEQFAVRCREDLQVIRQATGLECPVYAVLSGLDDVPEAAARGWYQRFPLMPDCDPEELAAKLKDGIEHQGLETIPRLVRRQMRLGDDGAPGTLTEVLRDNIRQYHFAASVRSWQRRLYRLLTQGTLNDRDEPGLVAGCYFLSSARTPAAEREVEKALLADLVANQQAGTWTPQIRLQRERERTITSRGYALVLASGLCAVSIVGWYVKTLF